MSAFQEHAGYLRGLREAHAIARELHDELEAQHRATPATLLGFPRREHYMLLAGSRAVAKLATRIHDAHQAYSAERRAELRAERDTPRGPLNRDSSTGASHASPGSAAGEPDDSHGATQRHGTHHATAVRGSVRTEEGHTPRPESKAVAGVVSSSWWQGWSR